MGNRAIVYKSTGSWYLVKSVDQQFWNARLKGSLKLDGLTSTNPVVVGDEVELEIEDEDDNLAIITGIHNRKNQVSRQAPQGRGQQHIIASNIDQSLLIATLKEPKTSQGFIDRFLVTCEAYHIPAIIVLNKCDLYGKKEQEIFREWSEMYQAIGYRIFRMSLADQEGLKEVTDTLQDEVTLVSGHSGVGKSSFINTVLPSLNQRTQDVSGWSGKGRHTTSFAEMFDLPGGGQVIDTPGIREFGLFDISRTELSHYFPEMRERLQHCHFNNCLHINEPGCAIKKALGEGDIFTDRYISYCNILESIGDNQYS